MQPLRNVMLQNVARALADDVTDSLPINPLYCVYYTLRAQQNAKSGVTDARVSLANILAAVSKIEILFNGSAVISGSLTDIAVLMGIFHRRMPITIHQGDAANNSIAVTVPIYLGRPSMYGKELFPATRKGELVLHRTIAAATTNIKAGTITEQVETVEILDGNPSGFLKAVTLSGAFAATGQNDIDLPLGNPYIRLLLFGNTPFNALPSVATLSQLKLLVDNVEFMTALSNWETTHGQFLAHMGVTGDWTDHTHTENLAAAYTADVATGGVQNTEPLLDNYAQLDFDAWDDDTTLLETANRGRVNLRITAGTADAWRIIPMELVRVQAAAQAAA